MSAPPTKQTFDQGPKTPLSPRTFNGPNITISEEGRQRPEVKRQDTSGTTDKVGTPGGQVITFGPDQDYGQSQTPPLTPGMTAKRWVPMVLSPTIPATLCAGMIISAIGLQVAYHFTKKNNGWPVPGSVINRDYVNYALTWPPVIAAMAISFLWTAMDREVMRMQPYVDLARNAGTSGDALLLDYTSDPKFFVWIAQFKKGHILAALSTLIILMLMGLHPLASSLLYIKPTDFVRPPIGVPKFGTVGINETLLTLEGFASAAGFAEADSRYRIGRPPYVWQSWAVDEFERPTSFISNGTMQANTTGIRTLPNCAAPETQSLSTVVGGSRLTGTWNSCTFSTDFIAGSRNFGVDVTSNCTSTDISGLADPFKPVVFWFRSPSANPPIASLVFCQPTLTLQNATVTVNLANGTLINVVAIGDYGLPSDVTSGPPLNGQVPNGVEFNITSAAPDILLRANTTQLQLPASIFNVLEQAPGGIDAMLQDSAVNQLVNITSARYQLYLALSARSNFFVTDNTGATIPAVITEVQQRLWMARLATHLLTAILLVAALIGAFVHYGHFQVRKDVKLYAPPGSIATTASVTAKSPLLNMLDSGMDKERIEQIVLHKNFRVDDTGRIILAGERGYAEAKSPRRSVYGNIMALAK